MKIKKPCLKTSARYIYKNSNNSSYSFSSRSQDVDVGVKKPVIATMVMIEVGITLNVA